MKRLIVFLLVGLLSVSIFAQENSTLRQIRTVAENLRTAKGNVAKHKQAVRDLTPDNFDIITLMDDLKANTESYEDHSVNADPFRFNTVIGYAYKRKHGVNVSKQEFYDSREKGVHYSAIEKTIQGGKTITYTLSKHSGKQEFVIVPFDVNAKYSVKIGDEELKKAKYTDTYLIYILQNVTPSQDIKIEIHNKSPKSQSFVIMNYNEQK